MSNKLNKDEIFLTLTIDKNHSESNYYFFHKYLNGYDYGELNKCVNGSFFPLTYEQTEQGMQKLFIDLPILAEKYGYVISKSTKDTRSVFNSTNYSYNDNTRNNYGFDISFSHITPQSEFNNLVLDRKILEDPSLISMRCQPRIKSQGGNATTEEITNFRNQSDFAELKYDFLYWFFVMPPIGRAERESEFPFPDEILLNAPYYKTEKLPSGSILLQMTEKTDFTKFDQEYWDKMIEIYRYFQKFEQSLMKPLY